MKKEALRVTSAIPVAPTTLYFAWLSSEQHSAMTGGAAKIDPTVGATFTAWNGKISGKLVILDLGRRIVMSWRTSDFPSDAHDSRVEVHFEGLGAGTRLTVLHTDIPEGLGESTREAWQSKYFVPMRAYFSKYLPDPRNPPVRRLPPPPPDEDDDEIPARTKGKPAKSGLANAAASLVKKTVAAVKAKVTPTSAKPAKPTLAKPTPPKMAQASSPSARKTAKPAPAKPAKPAKKATAKPSAPKKAVAKPAKKATAKPAKKPVAPKKKGTAKPAKPAKPAKKAAAKSAKTKTKKR
jgi:hypothetical protein